MKAQIKNIIFDIGNVLVRWAPLEIIGLVFPEVNATDFYQRMRPIWIDLNLGKFTEEMAIDKCVASMSLPRDQFKELMHQLTWHQKPLEGSIALLQKLQGSGFNLFAITDNVREIMEYHREFSEFPRYFKDIIVSAEIGVLKPDSRIYKNLIDKHQLQPSECVFIDDMMANVEGAIAVGMHAFQFTDMQSCEHQLESIIGDFY